MAKLSKELPEEVLSCMHRYYEKLLSDYKDVVTVKEVTALTGYAKTTINNWCNRGQLKSFRKGQLFYIPKVFLADFFLLADLSPHYPKELVARANTKRFSKKTEKVMCDLNFRTLAPVYRFC